jgi:Leucine-rich repeat (LRR) protein
VDWSKFINLEYLSLKNDHLKEIPSGITKNKTLKSIDLSGNDFAILPSDQI